MAFGMKFLKGILIGAGAILPGISSGVLCVIFGIYEKLVNSILNLKNNLKENFLFLLPFASGGAVGIFLFSKLLNYFFHAFPMPTKSLFIGFIIGSVPILLKKANSKRGFRLHYLLYLLVAFAIGISSIQLEAILPTLIGTSVIGHSFVHFILAGIAMSSGIVIPGVSSTVILMAFGVYSTYLQAISDLNFSVLLPMGIGILIGCLALLKLVQWCLENYFSQTFYSIIGFVLGSVFVLYPGYSFDMQSVFSLLLLLSGFFIGLKLEKLENG